MWNHDVELNDMNFISTSNPCNKWCKISAKKSKFSSTSRSADVEDTLTLNLMVDTDDSGKLPWNSIETTYLFYFHPQKLPMIFFTEFPNFIVLLT